MNGLEMRVTCPACPLQIEGTIDGTSFYFRSRWSHWSMGIGWDPVGNPLWLMSGPWGHGDYGAGWMPEHIGQAIVEKCAELWRVAQDQEWHVTVY